MPPELRRNPRRRSEERPLPSRSFSKAPAPSAEPGDLNAGPVSIETASSQGTHIAGSEDLGVLEKVMKIQNPTLHQAVHI